MLFPFARRIVADVVRDGGMPPLMIEPIDFVALYQAKLAQGSVQPVGNAYSFCSTHRLSSPAARSASTCAAASGIRCITRRSAPIVSMGRAPIDDHRAAAGLSVAPGSQAGRSAASAIVSVSV